MRARWLKPEFFTDKKVSSAGPITALVYQALWCMADDGGTAPCDPDTIKAQMFYRWSAVGVPEITGAIQQLVEMRRIDRYTVGDDAYARIIKWTDHQQVHKPSKFRYPTRPQGVTQNTPEVVQHSPGTTPEPLPASPPPRLLDSKTPRHPRAVAQDAAFEEAWAKYPKRAGGNSKSLARKAWAARVREGVEPAEMLAGTDRYAAFLRATGKEGSQFVKQAATFFGPDAHWSEPWNLPDAPPSGAPANPPVTGARRETFKDADERREREEGERRLVRDRWGNVEQRRAEVDGEAWWERVQREAKAAKQNPVLYAYDRMHEPAELEIEHV